MWSLRSLVIKVIKDFESVKLSLYIYNKYKLYRGLTRTYFLKMTLMTNDLNDHFAKDIVNSSVVRQISVCNILS